MSRDIDIIDVRPSQPAYITQDEAWRDLRRLVLHETGIDLEREHNFAVRIMPVKNSPMAAILCAPRNAPTARMMTENTFVSFFGSIGPEMANAADIMAAQGLQPGFCRRLTDQREAIPCPQVLH